MITGYYNLRLLIKYKYDHHFGDRYFNKNEKYIYTYIHCSIKTIIIFGSHIPIRMLYNIILYCILSTARAQYYYTVLFISLRVHHRAHVSRSVIRTKNTRAAHGRDAIIRTRKRVCKRHRCRQRRRETHLENRPDAVVVRMIN